MSGSHARRAATLAAAPSALRDLIATHDSSAPLPEASGSTSPDGVTQPRSLYAEIIDWMLAPLLLLWPLSVAITFVVARSLADEPFDRALVDHARVLEQEARRYLAGGPLPQGPQLAALLPGVQAGDISFQIIANDGEMLRGDSALPPPALYDFPEPGRVKLRGDQLNGQEVRVAYVHMLADDESTEPALLVQVAERLGHREDLANQIIRGVIFPQFVILPLAALLVSLGLARGLRPLRRVRDRLHDRSADDLSPIEPASVPAEIGPLVQAFNELLARLDDRIGAQKRFLADAAHQMKTPLAGLRMQAELALRERDPVPLRRSLEQIAIASDRAARLISQLLSLARTENQLAGAHFEPVDLATLARDTVADWAQAALVRSIDFGFESDDRAAWVRGNPVLLREMLGNLIDNALRYTPARGTVTVRLRRDGEQVELAVEDSGPGIALADRPLIFERFFRVIGTPGDGSGLGLAIVREIAAQHDAAVAVDGGVPHEPHEPHELHELHEPPAARPPPAGAQAHTGAILSVRFGCLPDQPTEAPGKPPGAAATDRARL